LQYVLREADKDDGKAFERGFVRQLRQLEAD
jgi:hypothetical protein